MVIQKSIHFPQIYLLAILKIDFSKIQEIQSKLIVENTSSICKIIKKYNNELTDTVHLKFDDIKIFKKKN